MHVAPNTQMWLYLTAVILTDFQSDLCHNQNGLVYLDEAERHPISCHARAT